MNHADYAKYTADCLAHSAKKANKKNPPKQTQHQRPWGVLVAKPRTQGTLDSWMKASTTECIGPDPLARPTTHTTKDDLDNNDCTSDATQAE